MNDSPFENSMQKLFDRQRRLWQSGERITVEELLADQPNIAADKEAVLDCIYAEIRLREDFDDARPLTDYVRRFPRLEAELRALFEVHVELDTDRPFEFLESNDLEPFPPTPFRLDRYECLDELGRGGMATVYRARHCDTNRWVALKVFRTVASTETTLLRMRREVELLASIDHPGVVAIHDAHSAGDVPFLVTELVEGRDLRRWIDEEGSLPVPTACECIRQAALALQAIHDCGGVHRDVKPENLMVTPLDDSQSFAIKVLDLGLGRIVEALSAEPLTRDGMILGSVDYMAPEQIDAPQEAGPAADIFSLGCTLFEALSGTKPFGEGGFVTRLLARVTSTAPPLASVCPEADTSLGLVVERMLQREPSERYASAKEVAAALAPFAAGSSEHLSANPARTAAAPPRPSRGPEGEETSAPVSATPSAHERPQEWVEVVAWAAATGEIETACRAILPLVSYWHFHGNLAEASEALQHVPDSDVESPVSPLVQCGVSVARAAVAFAKGNRDNALAEYERALVLARRCQSPAATAAVLADMAILRRASSDDEAVNRLCRRSIFLQREFGGDQQLPAALNTLGNLYVDRAELPRASRCFQEALELSAAAGRRHWEANHLLNSARVEQLKGNIAVAVGSAQKAQELHRAIGNSIGDAMAHINLGALSFELGDPADAERRFKTACATFTDKRNEGGRAIALINLGHLANEQGTLEHAKRHLDEAATLIDAQHTAWGTLLLNRAACALRSAEADTARAHLEDALEHYSRPERPLRLIAALELAAELEGRRRNHRNACKLLSSTQHSRRRFGAPVPPSRRAALGRVQVACESALGAAASRNLLAATPSVPLREAVAHWRSDGSRS